MLRRAVILLALLLPAGLLAAGEDDALRGLLQDEGVSERWIYDDIDAGFREAKKTGKPLLVCFSCVP